MIASQLSRRACERCRTKKIQCDRAVPICGNCASARGSSECYYTADKRRKVLHAQDHGQLLFSSTPAKDTPPGYALEDMPRTDYGSRPHGENSNSSNDCGRDNKTESGNSKSQKLAAGPLGSPATGWVASEAYSPRCLGSTTPLAASRRPSSLNGGEVYANSNSSSSTRRSGSRLPSVSLGLFSLFNDGKSYQTMHDDFPPKDTCDQLLQLLFDDSDRPPIGISKEEFEILYNDIWLDSSCIGDPNSRMLVLVVLTLASIIAHGLDNENGNNRLLERHSTTSKLFVQAKALVAEVVETPSLNGLCAITLMANFMTVFCSIEAQLGYSFLSMSMAISLGYHKRYTYVRNLEQHSHERICRLFWHSWTSACMTMAFSGRPLILMAEEIDTPYPRLMDTEDFEYAYLLEKICICKIVSDIAKLGRPEIGFPHDVVSLERMIFDFDVDRNAGKIKQFHLSELNLMLVRTKLLFFRNVLLNPDIQMTPQLVQIASITARESIRSLWRRYGRYFTGHRQGREILDWHFCYPVRSALMSVWAACMVLLALFSYKSLQAAGISANDEGIDIDLAIETLGGLSVFLADRQNWTKKCSRLCELKTGQISDASSDIIPHTTVPSQQELEQCLSELDSFQLHWAAIVF